MNCSVSCGCGDSEISSVGRENLKHLKVTQGGSSGREGGGGRVKGGLERGLLNSARLSKV